MTIKATALIIDNEGDYRQSVRKVLEQIGFSVCEAENSREAYERAAKRYDFVVLDSRDQNDESFWKSLLLPLRRSSPAAEILLVSQWSDNELLGDIKDAGEQVEQALRIDPLVSFLPKGKDEKMSEHFKQLAEFAEKVSRQKSDGAELSRKLVSAAFDAARELRTCTLEKLREVRVASQEKPEGTYEMDLVTEEKIKKHLSPEIHFRDVVICTEEAGLHNELYHRIRAPRFFVFSDPFDGSTAFRKFSKDVLAKDGNPTLGLVAADAELMKEWELKHGSRSLNSPMVSIVLSERHRVLSAILINLFTNDVYLSTEGGNFFMNSAEFSDEDLDKFLKVGLGDDVGLGDGLVKFEFSEATAATSTASEKLFLCSMNAVVRVEEQKRHIRYAHLETCVGLNLPAGYSWRESLDFRYKQRDFTPGPGRVLFLSDTDACRTYGRDSLEGRGYQCILSAGEPLTEWIGWFAFLRHASGFSAYCLRENKLPRGQCGHRLHDENPSTMLPDEIGSIFRNGYMDLAVLFTAYGRKARTYSDTILVVRDTDKSDWQLGARASLDEKFVRISLFQAMQT